LVGFILLLLWRSSRRSRAQTVAAGAVRQLSFRNIPILLVIPTVATATYAAQLAAGVKGIAPIHFYRAGGWISVAILAWAVYRILQPSTTPQHHNETEPLGE
jgi:uncharacterized membrane protein